MQFSPSAQLALNATRNPDGAAMLSRRKETVKASPPFDVNASKSQTSTACLGNSSGYFGKRLPLLGKNSAGGAGVSTMEVPIWKDDI